MKPDEVAFLIEVYRWKPGYPYSYSKNPNYPVLCDYATDISDLLGMNHKRSDYLLRKWCHKGWWECGVSERSGWFTDKGRAKVAELLELRSAKV